MKIRQVEFNVKDIVEGMILLMRERGYNIDLDPNDGIIVEIDDTCGSEVITIDFDPTN